MREKSKRRLLAVQWRTSPNGASGAGRKSPLASGTSVATEVAFFSREMEEGHIASTPTTRRLSSLPALPRLPLLLHPHRPLLFFAHGSEFHLFNYASQKWEVPQGASNGPHFREKQLAESNPLIEDAEGVSTAETQSATFHSQDVVAADCLCIQCGSRSSQAPFRARRRCTDSAGPAGECLWVTAGDDKVLCVCEDESFKLLQRRQQRKKIAVLTFGPFSPAPERQRSHSAVFVGDRFGEVFCLPLSKMDGVQRFAGDVKARRMQTIEPILGVRSSTPGTAAALSASSAEAASSPCGQSGASQPLSDEAFSDADAEEVDMPVLAHSATLTCMQITSPSEGSGLNWLLTADRDEKIRVCRVETPWKLESAMVGHEQFVTDAKILHVSSPLVDAEKDALVVSAGADCCVKIWQLLSGGEIFSLSLGLDALFPCPSLVERVEAQVVEVNPVSRPTLDSAASLAVLRGALLPVQVFHDAPQGLLVVQTLQLRGILLLRVDLGGAQSPELLSASVVPLPCTVGALLVSRHPLSEVQSLEIFAPMQQQLAQLGSSKRESLLVGWVVDREGTLLPPVCLELELLEADPSLQEPFLALLQGQPVPRRPESRGEQKQHEIFFWKTTCDPDAPTAEERRAKRQRNKRLQQQQQQLAKTQPAACA